MTVKNKGEKQADCDTACMPVMTGVEAVGLIIKDKPDAKIIMISALNQKQMVFEALKNGAKHYILKPIDPENVLSTVNSVIQNIKAEEEF